MKIGVAGFVTMLMATPVLAQIQPEPAGGDPRLQQVDYNAGQIVQLLGSPGYQMMVELSPDEQVQSVGLGDSSAWQVSINKAGDRLFLKPSQANAPTNMTVVTSVRVYNFALASIAEPSPAMPYTVQFRYPAAKAAAAEDSPYVDVAAAMRRSSRYKVTGDRQLLPAAITNDGQRTLIKWARSAAIPAVYAVNERGRDVLVNGMMGTDDIYLVDGVPDRLKFRIDDQVAYAVRLNPKKKR